MLARRPLLSIFLLALTLRVAASLALRLGWGPEGLMIEDSAGYLLRAAEGGRQIDVMPLYIFYLRACQALFGTDPLWPVLGQAAIDALTCVVVARTAAIVEPRLALAAGLIAALNPTQIVIAAMVITESLFIFFCALALWAAIAWLRRPGWAATLGLGVALGLGLLSRAMLLPWVAVLPVLLAAAALIAGRPPRSVAMPLAATALALALVAPVMLANRAEHGGFGLTSQGGVHSLLWVAPLVMEAADGTSHGEGARRLGERFAGVMAEPDPFARSRAMTAAAITVLGELGPRAVARAWAYGAAINLFSPAIILAMPVRTLPRTGFFATAGDSKAEKVLNFLFRNDNTTYARILMVAAVLTLAVRAGQLLGLWRLMVAGDRLRLAAALLLLAWIGFVLAINGPVASAKYRAPAEPAFAVLLAAALVRRRPPFTPPPAAL